METFDEHSTPPLEYPSLRDEFPEAAATYGRATSFMDRFDSDPHATSRITNLHYPFAGKDEWELASFLHSSGLSMHKIDEFLKLKLVYSLLLL